MPGIVVFGRRWSVGSDDMVLPALFMVLVHVIWLAALSYIFTKVEFDPTSQCSRELKDIVLGYIVILLACIIVESVVTLISIRGSILDTQPRLSMQYLLYMRIVVFLGEFAWLVVSIRWIVRFYFNCRPDDARKAILGISIFNGCMILMCIIALWCTFDSAGRKWVKFKRYQESMKEKAHRSRRSGSARRNWRQRERRQHYQCQYMQRKAMRAYEESWDRRLGLMCCCVERKGRNKNSMSEIAQLFTEFFRDLDVVPSDVIAGLVLLRRFQKLRMEFTINQEGNDVYRYLSGVAVTPRTQFLQLGQPEVMQQYKLVIHYMKFAMAAYGWPIFMMMNTGTGLCRIVPYLRCCCCQDCCKKVGIDYELDDNCCQCNVVALKKISGLPDMDLVYVTYHVDIGETPFYVALDNKHKKIVICVRGTLSLQDVLTDLKADAEPLPLDPTKEEWLGHKGMVQAAIYIKKKLKEDLILAKAFQKAKDVSQEKYDLVLVGHSLGAGTAAILAIMLQQEYQDIQCYAYSPPGGLLSMDLIYWSSLPGVPKKLKWPVKVSAFGQYTSVYCKSDDAYFRVKLEQLIPFPGEFEKLKQQGLVSLAKRPRDKIAFLDDVEWALKQVQNSRGKEPEQPTVSEEIEEERSVVPDRPGTPDSDSSKRRTQSPKKTSTPDPPSEGRERTLTLEVKEKSFSKEENSPESQGIDRQGSPILMRSLDDTGEKVTSQEGIVEVTTISPLSKFQEDMEDSRLSNECIGASADEKSDPSSQESMAPEPITEQIDLRDRTRKHQSEEDQLWSRRPQDPGSCLEEGEIHKQLAGRKIETEENDSKSETERRQVQGKQESPPHKVQPGKQSETSESESGEEAPKSKKHARSSSSESEPRRKITVSSKQGENVEVELEKMSLVNGRRHPSRSSSPDPPQWHRGQRSSSKSPVRHRRSSSSPVRTKRARSKSPTRKHSPSPVRSNKEQSRKSRSRSKEERRKQPSRSSRSAVTSAKDSKDEEDALDTDSCDDSFVDPNFVPNESDIESDIEDHASDFLDTEEYVCASESDSSDCIQYFPALTVEKTPADCRLKKDQAGISISSDSQTSGSFETLSDLHYQSNHEHDLLDEGDIERDKTYPDVFIRKMKQSKNDRRIYDNYHCCLVCKKMKSNIRKHILVHKENDTVKKIMRLQLKNEKTQQKEIERLKTILRNAGDNAHNQVVFERKKGELIVSRRPASFNLSDFGPCPNCFEWIKMGVCVTKHQKQCAGGIKDGQKLSKGQMVVRSNVLKGVLSLEASAGLLTHVYPIMTRDRITEIAQRDSLIVGLGNFSYRQSVNNKGKRKYITSSRMRGAARLLKSLREKHGMDMSMKDFLNVDYFESCVEAALSCASPDEVDTEDLKHPSAALKAGNDLFQMADIQIGIAVQDRDVGEKEELEGFIFLLKKNWRNRVARLANKLLRERKMLKKVQLPNPSDLQKLASYLKEKLSSKSYDTYRSAAEYSLCRLLLYNKRRSGELESTLKLSYHARSETLDESDEAVIGDLTPLEKRLLASQEIMKIEGKGEQTVPVIIPTDAAHALEYIMDPAVRKDAGIKEDNPYLFATRGDGSMRAYETLKRVCTEVEVVAPDTLTSVNLRKYFATMTQVIGLKDHELGWLCKHLGHTTDVHKLHYRAASGYIERINIGKLMLLQDFNVASKFKGQSLEDIRVEDILETAERKDTGLGDIGEAEQEEAPDRQSLIVNSVSQSHRKNKKVVRQKWSLEEEEELNQLFEKNIRDCVCPSKQELRRAVSISREKSGKIHLRTLDNIKKKVWNMYKNSECVEATKSFITSVVIAKDVVPRIGLHQMELLRTDLINIIKKSKNPKWKIIMKALCCGTESASQLTYDDIKEDLERNVTKHPSDEQIGLTAHKPMFPPGKIILVVRKHSGEKKVCGQVEPVYQAIWADNSDFQEVLVSPTMVNDHMPDNVLEALEKVLVNVAPPKPTRLLSEPERSAMLKHDTSPGTPETPSNQPATTLGDQPTVHIVCEKQTDLANMPVDVYINSNNVGWDAATEELLLSLDKEHLFSSIGHNPRLELLDLDSELIQAPLASPEALSAASSMSALSRTGSVPKSEQRFENTSVKLATIQQSPEICVRGEDSVENLCDIENETANLNLRTKSLNESRSVGDFLRKSEFLQTSDLKDIAHASQGSLNNLLPNIEYSNSQEALNTDTQSIDTPIPDQVNIVTEPNSKHKQLDINDKENIQNENEENKKAGNKMEGDSIYERHSPTETTQYGYFDPNEIYSAASVGYHPQLLVGGTPPAKSLKPSESQKLAIHPSNKILQYSQSESRLKGLSEEYKMKRSTEEGDIANLEDTSNVFVHDKLLKKNLKARGSEPVFNPKSLPKFCSEDKLYSVQETESINSEMCDTSDGTFVNEKVPKEGEYVHMSEGESAKINHTSVDTEDNISDSEHNDKTCLLKRIDSESEMRTVTEDRPKSETGHRKDSTSIGRVSTLSSPEDGDTRLFHSNSCHSTFASSTSGESEQRLSLISANSEDLPIVETDV